MKNLIKFLFLFFIFNTSIPAFADQPATYNYRCPSDCGPGAASQVITSVGPDNTSRPCNFFLDLAGVPATSYNSNLSTGQLCRANSAAVVTSLSLSFSCPPGQTETTQGFCTGNAAPSCSDKIGQSAGSGYVTTPTGTITMSNNLVDFDSCVDGCTARPSGIIGALDSVYIQAGSPKVYLHVNLKFRGTSCSVGLPSPVAQPTSSCIGQDVLIKVNGKDACVTPSTGAVQIVAPTIKNTIPNPPTVPPSSTRTSTTNPTNPSTPATQTVQNITYNNDGEITNITSTTQSVTNNTYGQATAAGQANPTQVEFDKTGLATIEGQNTTNNKLTDIKNAMCGGTGQMSCSTVLDETGIETTIAGKQATSDAQIGEVEGIYDNAISTITSQTNGVGDGFGNVFANDIPATTCTNPVFDASNIVAGARAELKICEHASEVQPLLNWVTYMFTLLALYELWFRKSA